MQEAHTMTEIGLAAANLKVTHDKRRNLARFLELIEEGADQGVDILVLPEVGLQGYADFSFTQGSREQADQKRYYQLEAESIPGPSTEIIRLSAEKHGMYIQMGMAESTLHGNALFNSTALIGPNGVVSVYRKIHNPFEWPYFNPGEDTPVAEVPIANLASVICYDFCFPELMRVYALKGAEAILVSTAWPMTGHVRGDDYSGWAMDLAAQSNAFFNQSWVVISNHCEKKAYSEQLDYYGGSQIVDPCGRVVAYLADDEGLIVHTADLHHEITKARTLSFWGNNLLQDRKPEHYGALVDQSYRHPSISTIPSEQELTKPRAQNGGTPLAQHDRPVRASG
jgi:predicted amidohydrolase